MFKHISCYDDINSVLAAGRADLCVLGRYPIDRTFDTTD